MTFGAFQHDNLERLVVLDSSPAAQSDGEGEVSWILRCLVHYCLVSLGLAEIFDFVGRL